MASSIVDKPLHLVNFTNFSIMEYAEQFPALTGNNSVITKIKKGSLLFNEKFVSRIFFLEPTADNSFFEISAVVKAEMKKKETYTAKVRISPECKVLNANCTCKAGAEPSGCKHVFALLHAVEDYSTKELYAAPTERLQSWHQPKSVTLKPEKASDVFKANMQLKNTTFNWSALKDTNIALMRCCNDSVEVLYSRTIPLPAIAFAGTSSVIDESNFKTKAEELTFHKHYVYTINSMVELEKKTMLQNSDEWRNMRLKYITGSSVHSVLTRKADFEKLAESIFHDKKRDLSRIAAVAYGQNKEGFVRDSIKKKYFQYTMRRTGLVLNPALPFLAASPDGLLFHKEDAMLLEIKCLYNPLNLSLEELFSTRGSSFCLARNDGVYKLKHKHSYYRQMQTQLAVSNLTKGLFVLYYSVDGHDYFHEEVIQFDALEWATWVINYVS
ncbi:uncharacterized protein LOC129218950 [Uloborus diversus]|uniref:uncharacterized protein LOC129218950 n=1 Tax=Uloborus diversus TaxID=327109 RepID=UPI002409C5C4|nr:uncharacterized protein LOC129218950 [Uloborus diversus]